MRKAKKYHVQYVYDQPKTSEQRERQQRILVEAYNVFFERALGRFAKEKT